MTDGYFHPAQTYFGRFDGSQGVIEQMFKFSMSSSVSSYRACFTNPPIFVNLFSKGFPIVTTHIFIFGLWTTIPWQVFHSHLSVRSCILIDYNQHRIQSRWMVLGTVGLHEHVVDVTATRRERAGDNRKYIFCQQCKSIRYIIKMQFSEMWYTDERGTDRRVDI